MSFENDHKAFIKAISIFDISNAESIFAQCDNKTFYIKKALEKYEPEVILSLFESFRSVGLKRNLDKIITELNIKKGSNDESYSSNAARVVLTHKRNKMKNKLYHLSGSSFENENIPKEEIIIALENSVAKKVAS